MARFKVNRDSMKTQINIKLTYQERFLDIQCKVLAESYVQGLMRLSSISGSKAVFSAPANTKLCEMLNRGIDKNTFFCIVVQLINTLNWLSSQKYLETNLVINPEYTFINPTTKEMYMLYVPADCVKPKGSLKFFIESLIYESSFVYGEDGSYRQELIKLLGSEREINAEALEEYVMTYCSEMCGSIVRYTKRCAESADRISSSKSEMLRQTEQNRRQSAADSTKSRSGTDIFYGSGALSGKRELGTVVLEDEYGASFGTVVLDENVRGTTLLNESGTVVLEEDSYTPNVRCPQLIRKRTGEEVSVDKPVFRIGKEEGAVDFLICDNSTVSRNHADIITRDGRYFIYDNNSTNRTYVNNKLVEPLKNIEIFDGVSIRLSDEEFEFRIKYY